MKKLPPWKELLKNFPNKDAGTVFTEIGGKVKLNYDIGVFSNACAIRISKALNFSGEIHRIPFYKSKIQKVMMLSRFLLVERKTGIYTELKYLHNI